MHVAFTLARFYPYWALPVILVVIELGIFFRRRASSLQWGVFTLAGILLFMVLLWFGFRGDIHSDAWIKSFL